MEQYTDGIHIIEAIIPNTKEKLVELVKYMQGKSYMSVHNIATRSLDTVVEEAIKKWYICFKCLYSEVVQVQVKCECVKGEKRLVELSRNEYYQ